MNNPTRQHDDRLSAPLAEHADAPNTPNTPNTPDVSFGPAPDRRAMLAGLGGLAAGAFLTSKAHAGPLNPPPGPVAGSGKTTQEIFDKISIAEPRIPVNAATTPGNANATFRISQFGSYYLTDNFTGEAGKHGIEIAVSNVTLDLNGFSIIGATGALNGVHVSAFRGTNIVIRNGLIRTFPGSGVLCEPNFGNPPHVTIDRVQAQGNGGDGFRVEFNSRVISCVAIENGARGIYTIGSCRIENSQSSLNGTNGIETNISSIVIGCASTSNGGAGFAVSLGTLVTDSIAANNNVGITGSGAVIESCCFYSNAGNGIGVSIGCAITSCIAYSNSGHGISTGQGATVIGCSAYINGSSGISVGAASTVQSCSARLNGVNGILASTATLLTGNQCSSNSQNGPGGAGLSVSGSDNRIEGNNSTSQNFGYNVVGTGNILTRNTASGNTTNWLITANNYYGPIIDIAGTASPSVSGSAANSTLGSTNAHANFTY